MRDGDAVRISAADVRGRGGTPDGFASQVLTVLGLTTLVAAAALAAVFAADVFLLALAGILVAVLLRGLASLVGRWTPLGEGWSMAVVLASLLAIVGLGSWFLASELVEQFGELSGSLTKAAEDARERLGRYSWGDPLLAMIPSIEELSGGGHNFFGRLTGAFSTALGGLANLVVVLFVGLYVAVDPGQYRRGFLRLIPPARRRRGEEVLDEVNRKLEWWLLGRLLCMTVVGVMTCLGLWLLGVPLAFALGFLAFLLNFIPYIGPIASAVPALLVTLPSGPTQTAYVALLYLGIQLLESYLLTPLINQRAVKLPPALTILCQLLLGVLAGLPGLAMASPLMAVAITAVNRLYIEDVLGDRPDSDPTSSVKRPSPELDEVATGR